MHSLPNTSASEHGVFVFNHVPYFRNGRVVPAEFCSRQNSKVGFAFSRMLSRFITVNLVGTATDLPISNAWKGAPRDFSVKKWR